MIISNRYGLPQPIYRAICHNWYNEKNPDVFCSATELIKPLKISVLHKKHRKEITRDAVNLLWCLDGSAMHEVLKKSEFENSLVEERLYARINDELVSGGFDNYEDEVVSDYKNWNVFICCDYNWSI